MQIHAGISVVRELVKHKKTYQDMHIVIFDNKKTFGTGMPYQFDDEVLLLNQTPETMSIAPEGPLRCINWLQQHTSWSNPVRQHVPRRVYGEYLQAFLWGY